MIFFVHESPGSHIGNSFQVNLLIYHVGFIYLLSQMKTPGGHRLIWRLQNLLKNQLLQQIKQPLNSREFGVGSEAALCGLLLTTHHSLLTIKIEIQTIQTAILHLLNGRNKT